MKTLAGVPVVDRAGTRLVEHRFDGRPWPVAQPVTFTPFASVRPCSARCVFCSETLWHKDARILSASLRPGPSYFDGLAAVLDALRGLPSVSLSGLEATDDADWLCRVLDQIDERAGAAGGLVLEEKVLYSNGAGLARETTGARLLPRLKEFGLTRVEASRHHHTQAGNDAVMRFRPGKAIRALEVFERTVADILRHVPVRLVCVVQKGGVDDFDQVYDTSTGRGGWGHATWCFGNFHASTTSTAPAPRGAPLMRGGFPFRLCGTPLRSRRISRRSSAPRAIITGTSGFFGKGRF